MMPSRKEHIPWVVENVELLKIWCEENGYKPYTKLRDELKIPANAWEIIMNDSRSISRNLFAYAALFRKTGFFDPRTIPSMRKRGGNKTVTVARRMTDEEYLKWLQNPVVKSSLADSQEALKKALGEATTERDGRDIESNEPSWAEKLANAIKPWCDNNGYPVRTQFSNKMGFKVHQWASILGGRTYQDDVSVYAKIYVVTDLEEANPTTIPPKIGTVPRTGVHYPVKRKWEPEELEAWKKSPEGRHFINSVRPMVLNNTDIPTSIELVEIAEKSTSDNENFSLSPLARLIAGELKPDILAIFDRFVSEQSGKIYVGAKAPVDIRTAIQTLVKELQKVANQGTSSSTQFANMYGQILSELFPLVEGFSIPSEKAREEFLERNVRNQKKIEVSR